MNRKIALSALVLACALTFAGCLKKEITDFAGIKLSPTIALPLGSVNVVLENVLRTQDSLLTVEADNSLALRYRRDSVVYFTFADLVDNIAGGWSAAATHVQAIGKVALDPITQQTAIRLGELMAGFSDQDAAHALQTADGNMAPVPALEGASSSVFLLPPQTTFTEIQIDTMKVVLALSNGFPFDIQQLAIELIDQVSGQAIPLPPIAAAAGQTSSLTFELTNLLLHHDLAVRIAQIESPGTGSTPVPIDLDDELILTLTMEETRISGGMVQIPAVSLSGQATFELQANADARISEIRLGEAVAFYALTSTLPFPIEVYLTLPSATQGGNVVQHVIQVPGQGQVSQALDLSGARIDLTQDSDQPYNRIPVNFHILTMPPAGQVAFSAADGITFELTIDQMNLDEAWGYFGQVEEPIEAEQIDFDFDFSFIDESSSPIFFDDARLTIEYENAFGFPIEAQLDLVAHGRQNQAMPLSSPALHFDSPPMSQAGSIVQGTITLDGSNSNIVDMLSMYPTYFTYAGMGRINPQGDQGQTNYVLPSSYLLMHLDFDMPLRMRTQQLVIRDTVELSPRDSLVGKVAFAEILLDYRNGFPFEASLKLNELYSGTSIIEEARIPAASVDAEGKVHAPKEGRTTLALTADQVDLLLGADRLELILSLATTQGGQTPVALYTHYSIELGLGIRAELDVEQGF